MNKINKWSLSFRVIYVLIGALAGMLIYYLVKGKFDMSLFLGVLAGIAILIIFNVIKVLRKKDRVPEADERTVNNLLKFFTFLSNIYILVLLGSLGIITLIEIETIPITYLWLVLIAYLLISSIGSLIISRR